MPPNAQYCFGLLTMGARTGGQAGSVGGWEAENTVSVSSTREMNFVR